MGKEVMDRQRLDLNVLADILDVPEENLLGFEGTLEGAERRLITLAQELRCIDLAKETLCLAVRVCLNNKLNTHGVLRFLGTIDGALSGLESGLRNQNESLPPYFKIKSGRTYWRTFIHISSSIGETWRIKSIAGPKDQPNTLAIIERYPIGTRGRRSEGRVWSRDFAAARPEGPSPAEELVFGIGRPQPHLILTASKFLDTQQFFHTSLEFQIV